MGLHRAIPMRAKPPGCFFVRAVERAGVHPGGHAVELLPHLEECGDDDVDDDDDDVVLKQEYLAPCHLQ